MNVVAFVSRPDKVGTCHGGKLVEERSIEELLAHFEGWEEEVQQILRVKLAIVCYLTLPYTVRSASRSLYVGLSTISKAFRFPFLHLPHRLSLFWAMQLMP